MRMTRMKRTGAGGADGIRAHQPSGRPGVRPLRRPVCHTIDDNGFLPNESTATARDPGEQIRRRIERERLRK
jgi:hypothetical protein